MVRFMRGLPTPDYNNSGATPASAAGAVGTAGTAHSTFTGFIGKACNYPLRGIIYLCVKFRISPNVLTFVGMVVNVTAAVLAERRRTGAWWRRVELGTYSPAMEGP